MTPVTTEATLSVADRVVGVDPWPNSMRTSLGSESGTFIRPTTFTLPTGVEPF